MLEPLVPQRVDVGIDPPAHEHAAEALDDWAPGEGGYRVQRSEITVDLGPVSVPAWLFEPLGAPDGPGVVFVHGAGTVTPDAFEAQVTALAAAGIRALVPAKRIDTYSTRERDYIDMADDYLHSWHALRELPGVQAHRVGLYGESEGAWIVPVAAVAEPEVAFVILASAPVVSPREQAAYATANYLHNTNAPRGMFRAIPRALGAKIPGGGFEYVDFDVTPYLDQLNQPVLMVYGTGDASMPVVQGAQTVMEHLQRRGNDQVTVRYFKGADHGLRVGGALAPRAAEVLRDWVGGLPGTAVPQARVAGADPTQRFVAGPVPEPRWYASGNFLIYSALVVVGLSVGGVVLCAWAAVRRAEWGPVVRHSIATVLAAFALVAVFIGYVGQVADLAVNYRLNDAVVIGGWVLVHVTGLFAVIIAVLSIRAAYIARARRARGHGPGLSALTRVGAWACHLGALSLLLLASYWGVFPGVG